MTAPNARLVTSLKCEGKDAPWLVIYSDDAAMLQDQLRELESGSVLTDIGRTQRALHAKYNIGYHLEAKGLDPQHSDSGTWGRTENTMGVDIPVENLAPAVQEQFAQQAAQAAAFVQQAPQFPAATGAWPPAAPLAAAPVAAPAAAAAPTPVAAVPVAAPVQQAPAGWPSPMALPTPAAAPAAAASPFAAPAAIPGAPMILGRPAVMQSGSNSKGGWTAWFDPRSMAELDAIPKLADGSTPSTDDPNDPGLAAGTVKFTKFMR